ncbi:MAG: hypothetical protein AABW87_02230 [Nanoarchaeota archaeon]
METKRVFTIIGFVVLILTASYLAYDNYQKKNIIHERNIKINETLGELDVATGNINFLNETLTIKNKEIEELSQDVTSKQQRISEQEFKIKEITETTLNQKEEIQHLREVQANLQEEGKIIVDQYKATLVLYDNVDIYEKQSPFMEIIKSDPISYSKLGIPFFYFRDETKKVEDSVILGTYSTLYNYIYIYRDNNDTRTLYHEIAHIIYKKLFLEVPSNLQTWKDFYKQLKDANLLSTEYSKKDEIEGFAEEYSVYKTGVKNQPQSVKDFFRDVDEVID